MQIAGEHDAANADRTDGEVHAAGRQDDHRRKADDNVDSERPRDGEEIEGRNEARRQTREHDPERDDDAARVAAPASSANQARRPERISILFAGLMLALAGVGFGNVAKWMLQPRGGHCERSEAIPPSP